jgi:hypothetical protein
VRFHHELAGDRLNWSDKIAQDDLLRFAVVSRHGQLVTGLAPWSAGAHVVMGTPQGYRGDGSMCS